MAKLASEAKETIQNLLESSSTDNEITNAAQSLLAKIQSRSFPDDTNAGQEQPSHDPVQDAPAAKEFETAVTEQVEPIAANSFDPLAAFQTIKSPLQPPRLKACHGFQAEKFLHLLKSKPTEEEWQIFAFLLRDAGSAVFLHYPALIEVFLFQRL